MEKNSIIDNLDKGIIEFYINNNLEDLVSLAKVDGFDPALSIEKRNKVIKNLRFLAKAKLNKEQDLVLYEKAEKVIKSIIGQFINKNISDLKIALQLKGLNFQFRNLDKLDEATIREILGNIELLKLIENFSEEADNEK